LEQESAKKPKTSEEVTEEAKSSDEVPEDKYNGSFMTHVECIM
nr:hypothetical protein [Tanacetum cinerariifolium]